MDRRLKSVVVLIFTFILIIAGCGTETKVNPREILENALEKSLDIKSYAYQASLKIDDLQFTRAKEADPSTQRIFTMLKNAKLHVSGVVQQQPLRGEVNFEVKLTGDMNMKILIPVVYTESKIWVKIPNIPIFPIPSDAVDKFLELDMKELNKSQNVADQQQFSSDLLKILKGKFDEKTYFTTVDKKNAGLPESVDAEQIIKFNVTNENLEQLIATFVTKVAPAVLELFEKQEEYRKEIKKIKENLNQISDEKLKVFLIQVKKVLKINELSLSTAINKDHYPIYWSFVANGEISTENGDKAKIATRITQEVSKINEKAEFKMGIPTNTITLKQVQKFWGNQ